MPHGVETVKSDTKPPWLVSLDENREGVIVRV